MINDEREQMMRMAEMLLPLLYANMPKNIKEHLNAKAEGLGISGDAFLVQTVEQTIWSRELATADSATVLTAIKERLLKCWAD